MVLIMIDVTKIFESFGGVFTGGLDHCLNSLGRKKPVIRYYNEKWRCYYQGREAGSATTLDELCNNFAELTAFKGE